MDIKFKREQIYHYFLLKGVKEKGLFKEDESNIFWTQKRSYWYSRTNLKEIINLGKKIEYLEQKIYLKSVRGIR